MTLHNKFSRQVNVVTAEGVRSVPASNTLEQLPHLAVTMTTFGRFEVTYLPTGHKLVGGYERAVSAMIAMVSLQLAFNQLGIVTGGTYDEFRNEMLSKDGETESLGSSISSWIQTTNTVMSVAGEFPWEGAEDSPYHELSGLLTKLGVDLSEFGVSS